MGAFEKEIESLEDLRQHMDDVYKFAEANWDNMDSCKMALKHYPREITKQGHEGFREYVEGPRSATITMITKRP